MYEPVTCVQAKIESPEQIDQIHAFDEDGRCLRCGWLRREILDHPRFKPWETE